MRFISTQFCRNVTIALLIINFLQVCSLEGQRPKRRYHELLADPDLNFDETGELHSEKESHMYTTIQVLAYDKHYKIDCNNWLQLIQIVGKTSSLCFLNKNSVSRL